MENRNHLLKYRLEETPYFFFNVLHAPITPSKRCSQGNFANEDLSKPTSDWVIKFRCLINNVSINALHRTQIQLFFVFFKIQILGIECDF